MIEKLGHYKIVSELGRGGMGVVYKAYEESLNRYVAIKVLGEHLSHDENFVKRFVREAKAAAGLSHPNVIQIFYIGHEASPAPNPHGPDERHYFVMEFVEGRSVHDVLEQEGALDPMRAARIVQQAASGLAVAHDQGLVHRDIKPANLLVTKDERVKIADFGLALAPTDGATRLTATNSLMGTPGYLSPEQCCGEPAGPRSDIYSLGMTFYEMLTGSMPFKGESPLAVLRQILDEEPPSLLQIDPDLDPRIAECGRAHGRQGAERSLPDLPPAGRGPQRDPRHAGGRGADGGCGARGGASSVAGRAELRRRPARKRRSRAGRRTRRRRWRRRRRRRGTGRSPAARLRRRDVPPAPPAVQPVAAAAAAPPAPARRRWSPRRRRQVRQGRALGPDRRHGGDAGDRRLGRGPLPRRADAQGRAVPARCAVLQGRFVLEGRSRQGRGRAASATTTDECRRRRARPPASASRRASSGAGTFEIELREHDRRRAVGRRRRSTVRRRCEGDGPTTAPARRWRAALDAAADRWADSQRRRAARTGPQRERRLERDRASERRARAAPPRRAPIRENPRIAVIAVGEPMFAGAAEEALETQLGAPRSRPLRRARHSRAARRRRRIAGRALVSARHGRRPRRRRAGADRRRADGRARAGRARPLRLRHHVARSRRRLSRRRRRRHRSRLERAGRVRASPTPRARRTPPWARFSTAIAEAIDAAWQDHRAGAR